ncbi:TolC family protein [Janthinobacterium sp. PC23-8]|uniref:TolC family protein n=1 Tax=Janthinobacterium sp. PC23-8 TaxID=2012679 RepID=UPI000B971BF7|nr:TolC family protein [Janthinobacterium sp. PC23-8]OYO27640.1 type I secretion protein TolC [Janthinobacterium sp. PC23-8]
MGPTAAPCFRLFASAVALLVAVPAHAQILSLDEALRQAAGASGAVQGAVLDVRARTLKAEALSNIDGPSLDLTAFRGRLSTDLSLDTSRLSGVVGGIGAALPNLPIPEIPNSLEREVVTNLTSFGLVGMWPIYTAGRLDAVKGVAAGMAREADAERVEAEEKLATQVAQRYFQLLLAQRVVAVRADVTAGVAQHQRDAVKLEKGGLISKAERLRADVAFDSARSEEAQARSDAEIAQVALDRLLDARSQVRPATPLFVHSLPVGSLQSFISSGLRENAAWKKIASKRLLSEQALRLHGKEYSPTVLAIGNYNLNRGGERVVRSNWAVGVMVSVPLVHRINTGKLIEAAKLDQERVEVTARQAGRDIPTLIEKHWRALENARIQFLSTGSSVELARENIRLQTVAFQQGQATSLEVVDARLNLAKIETQRAQTAYNYVLALAQLLEAAGATQRLASLAAQADLHLPLDTPQ